MANVGLRPYDFEPEHESDSEVSLSSDSDDSMDHSLDDDRVHSTNWCQCDNCVRLPTAAECLCCYEVRELSSKLSSQNIECITEHSDFGIVCLHPEVLRTAILARADIRQDEMQNPTANE